MDIQQWTVDIDYDRYLQKKQRGKDVEYTGPKKPKKFRPSRRKISDDERNDPSLYEGIPNEETIQAREVKRYQRYYNKRTDGKYTVKWDDYYDEISVFFDPSLGYKIREDTYLVLEYLRDNYFQKFIDISMALKIASDYEFPEEISGLDEPNGRRSLIGLISQSRIRKAIPILRAITVNDDSFACRYEAMKGLFLMKDKKGLQMMMQRLPRLHAVPYTEFNFGYLVLADGIGIKHLEDDILDLLEHQVHKYDPRQNPYTSRSFATGPRIDDSFRLLLKHSKGAAAEFVKEYYPSPHRRINESIEMALQGESMVKIAAPSHIHHKTSRDQDPELPF
jgi:hypothetical protein